MQLGMVGLAHGRQPCPPSDARDGHQCVVYDVDPAAVARLKADGAVGTASLDEFVAALSPLRTAWLMVPAGLTGETTDAVAARMSSDDVIIDGGNSYYRDDIERAERLAASGIHHVDVGTSGGVFGLERGFCLMIGGESEIVERLDPIFRSIAPRGGGRSPDRGPRGRSLPVRARLPALRSPWRRSFCQDGP